MCYGDCTISCTGKKPPSRASLLENGIKIVLCEDAKVTKQCFLERGDLKLDSFSVVVKTNKKWWWYSTLTPLKKTATVVCEISVAFIPSEVGEDTESKICDCNFSYCNCYVVRRIIFNLKNYITFLRLTVRIGAFSDVRKRRAKWYYDKNICLGQPFISWTLRNTRIWYSLISGTSRIY